MIRQCKACSKVLVKRDDERNSDFAKRQSCNAACGYAARDIVVVVEGRRCRACSKVLVKRDDERNSRFARRQSCDAACGYAARRTVVVVVAGVSCLASEIALALGIGSETVMRRIDRQAPSTTPVLER